MSACDAWRMRSDQDTCLGTLNSMVSREVLTDPRDRKYHSDIYRCGLELDRIVNMVQIPNYSIFENFMNT